MKCAVCFSVYLAIWVECVTLFSILDTEWGLITDGLTRRKRSLRRNQRLLYGKVFPDDDTGVGLNCGSNKTQMQFKWTPKIIDPRGSLQMYFSFILTENASNITATLDVHILGEVNPIFTIIQNATCQQISQTIKNLLQCPLQKNTPIKHSIESKSSLTRLPSGNFTVVLKVNNEANKQMLCINATLIVKRNY